MKTSSLKTFICILTGLISPFGGNAQTPTEDSIASITDTVAVKEQSKDKPIHLYRMNYWTTSIFCVVASAANVYAIPNVIKNKPDITNQEIQGLNKNVFTGLDYWALKQDPSKRDINMKASDYSLPIIIITPGLLALNKNIRKDWFRILLMYYEMHAVTFSIYNYSFFGPSFQNKYRPYVYYDQFSYDDRKGGNNRNSMYSGHTATAMASTFFMVKVFCDYHPEIGQKKYLLYAAATIPAIIEGYFRVKGLEHFPSDVLVGMSIGAACGILVPEIHRFKNHKVTFGVTALPMGNAGLNMVWNMDKISNKSASE